MDQILDIGVAHISYFPEENICRLEVHDGQVLALEHMYQIREWIWSQNSRQPYKLIVLAHPKATISPELRDYASNPERAEAVKADALVVQSFAQRLLVGFYLRFNKPQVPTKVFAAEEAARLWLVHID